MDTSRKFITVNELMEYFGIGRSTAYELVHIEGFPVFRIGKKILINFDDLQEWVKKGGTIGENGENIPIR